MGSGGPLPVTFPLQVELKAPEFVSPAEPTEESAMFLSNIDQILIYTVETVHFFAPTEQKSSDHVVEVLREGLSKLLVPYHFMAGRLRLNEEQRRLEIDCNRAGALFAEATAHNTLDELGDVSHPSPEFKKLVLQAFDVRSLQDLPLLLIQVTRFKCGGFAIGLGTNHSLLDGFAAVDFMKNFASIVRGEGLVITPQPDRTCLKARSPLQVNYEHTEFIKLSDLPEGVATSFSEPNHASGGGDVSGNMLPTETHEFRTFPFSGKELARLKETALEDGTVTRCSSFDVVTAHVWQARAKAMGLRPDESCSVFFAVDIRKRMNPPLPPAFSGNGVFSAHATACVRELREKPLSFCVKRIQDAVSAVTDEYVRSAVDWGELNHGVPRIVGGSIFVAAWWKLEFETVDFGWGRPIYCGPVVNGRVEFVLLLSSVRGDGCRFYLALEPQHMRKFEQLILLHGPDTSSV